MSSSLESEKYSGVDTRNVASQKSIPLISFPSACPKNSPFRRKLSPALFTIHFFSVPSVVAVKTAVCPSAAPQHTARCGRWREKTLWTRETVMIPTLGSGYDEIISVLCCLGVVSLSMVAVVEIN